MNDTIDDDKAIGPDGLTKEQRRYREFLLQKGSLDSDSEIELYYKLKRKEAQEYFKHLHSVYKEKADRESVFRSMTEGSLNLIAAAILMGASFASGGFLPAALAVIGASIGMMGWMRKSPVSPKIEADRRILARVSLTGSFLKRSDDIIRPSLALAGAAVAASTLLVPFAAVAFAASAFAFFVSAYNYAYYPEKANLSSLVGNAFNSLGTGAALGIAIASLVIGAAILSNPITLGVVGGLLVAGALIKVVPDIKEFFFPKQPRIKSHTFENKLINPRRRKSLLSARKHIAANKDTYSVDKVFSLEEGKSLTHLSSKRSGITRGVSEHEHKGDRNPRPHKKGPGHKRR